MTVCVTVRENIKDETECSRVKELYLQSPESIFDMMMRQEDTFLSFCGGKGMCGRCKIQYLTPPPFPKAEERRFLSPEELRLGIRLACLSHPREDCEIRPLYREQYGKEDGEEQEEILSQYELSLWDKTESGEDKDDRKQQIIAVDLGTTTIVMQRIRLKDNEILEERRVMNPQRSWGADVISRMEASIQGKREMLRKVLVDTLEEALDALQSPNRDVTIYIAGNTVMGHLLMGADMTEMSHYPFTPVTLEQTAVKIGKYQSILLPSLSAFVGADITAGIYATRMGQAQKEINILLDLGTNGEMAIGNHTRMIVTATAAGPAFEGRMSGERKGSDLIALVAELLDAGVVDETGLLEEPYFTEGYEIRGEIIRQEDIRALQMAKAAIYGGLCILMEAMEVTAREIAHVYLAGGFGYHLDVRKAERIGLLPKGLEEKAVAVGNTSLLGAYLYGKAQQGEKIKPPEEIQKLIEHIEVRNLAQEKSFESHYISAMNFPGKKE